MKTYLKKLKHHFEEVVKNRHSPESLAAGFAIGTFIAILPTFGLGYLIGILVISIFTRINKISMVAAFAIWNPFILIPLYSICYSIGNAILGTVQIIEVEINTVIAVYHHTIRYLLGSFILATVISAVSYEAIVLTLTYKNNKLKVTK
jgi:uncharacterized protein (DUF2062 family)